MASYQDETFTDPSAENLGNRIKTLLALGDSVEVLSSGNDLILRMWIGAPYNLGDHTNAGG